MSGADNDLLDWSLAIREGAWREQMRCWAELPLENSVAALEAMQEITERLHPEYGEVKVPDGSDEEHLSGNAESS